MEYRQVIGHRRKDVTVAPGAGRIVCSCGWHSSVRDDGYMFEPLSIPSLGQVRGVVMRNPNIEAEWHRHIVSLRTHAG